MANVDKTFRGSLVLDLMTSLAHTLRQSAAPSGPGKEEVLTYYVTCRSPKVDFLWNAAVAFNIRLQIAQKSVSIS